MMVFSIKDKNAGFTLVEVMISIVIAMFGILAVGTMQITSMKGNMQSRLTSEAANVAVSEMERLLTLDYAGLNDSDGDGIGFTDVDGNPATLDGDIDGDGDIDADDVEPGLDDATTATADGNGESRIYDYFWNVADNFPQEGVKTIRLIVNWSDRGSAKNITITNIKAEE